MKSNARQEMTGVVVNEKANIPNKSLKRFRALLYQIEKEGIEGKYWNKGGNVLAQIDGYANFIFQIEPIKDAFYKQRVYAILEKYNYKAEHKAKFPSQKSKENPLFLGGYIKKITLYFRK